MKKCSVFSTIYPNMDLFSADSALGVLSFHAIVARSALQNLSFVIHFTPPPHKNHKRERGEWRGGDVVNHVSLTT